MERQLKGTLSNPIILSHLDARQSMERIEEIYGIFEKTKVWKGDTWKEILVLTDDGAEKLIDKINEIIKEITIKTKRIN